jgi:hypothetical protein
MSETQVFCETLHFLDRFYDAYREEMFQDGSTGDIAVHFSYRSIQQVLRSGVQKELGPERLAHLQKMYRCYQLRYKQPAEHIYKQIRSRIS